MFRLKKKEAKIEILNILRVQTERKFYKGNRYRVDKKWFLLNLYYRKEETNKKSTV